MSCVLHCTVYIVQSLPPSPLYVQGRVHYTCLQSSLRVLDPSLQQVYEVEVRVRQREGRMDGWLEGDPFPR